MAQILLVEDEAALLEAMEEELKDEGYNVMAACNGIDALEKLANYEPDLILSDISMPDMDGYGLLEKVREDFPKLIETPFIFLTAFNAKEDVIRGKKLGADDYLVKPVDFDLLFATIESRLAQVERMMELKEQQFLKLYNTLRPTLDQPEEGQASAPQQTQEQAQEQQPPEVVEANLQSEPQMQAEQVPQEANAEQNTLETEEELVLGEELTEIPSGDPEPPAEPTRQDVLDYVAEHKIMYGILIHFENIKALFERTRRNSEINLNNLVEEKLKKKLPKSVFLDVEAPGCVSVYFAKNEVDANGFDFTALGYEVQNEIFESEVSELITSNIANTFSGSHLKVSQIPFRIDVTEEDIKTNDGLAKAVRTKLIEYYNEPDTIETIIGELRDNGSLIEASFKSRDDRTREVKFFHFDLASETKIQDVDALSDRQLAATLEYQRDLIFLEKLCEFVIKVNDDAIIAIDIHFETVSKPEKLATYKERFKNHFSNITKKFVFNVRGLPRNLNPRHFNDIMSKIGIPNAKSMLQLNPWTDCLLEVDQFAVPFIVWDFPDIYGFSSKLDHIKKLKLIYKRSQAPLLIRNIPNNCDIMFLKGYGFDGFSFNAE